MNMQQHQFLMIFFIAQILYVSRHPIVVGLPANSRSRDGEVSVVSLDSQQMKTTNSSFNYYDGYPQQDELKEYLPYLLFHLRGSNALSTINLALWDWHFESREEACAAVDEYIKKLKNQSSDEQKERRRTCQLIYGCNYDSDRFPSTIITVDCGYSYCETTDYNYPARGTCLEVQHFISTLRFVPDPTEEVEEKEAKTESGEASGEPTTIEDGPEC